MTSLGIKMVPPDKNDYLADKNDYLVNKNFVPRGEKKNIYIHYLRGRLCENGILLSRESFEESTISDLESPFPSQRRRKIIEIGQETTKLCFN